MRSWLGAFFYAVAHLVLPGGRPGRCLARFFLRQSLLFRPRDESAWGYSDYLSGILLLERGTPEEGLRLLRRATKALPQDPAVALDTGVAMTMGGEYEQAVRLLERLLRDYQRMASEQQLWFALAWSHLRLGHFTRAPQVAEQAATAAGGTAQLHLVSLLGRLVTTGVLEQQALRGLLQSRPRLLPQILEFTEQLAASGKTGAAQQLLQALPEDIRSRSLRLLIISALNGELLPAARWALNQLTSTAGEAPAYLVLESELHLREGNLPWALAVSERAVKLSEGKQAEAQEQCGEVLLLQGRAAEAYPHFVEALALGSTSALAGGVVALHLVEEDRWEEAHQVFRMERRGPALDCAYAHCATGLIQLHEGDLPEAVKLAQWAWDEYRALPDWAAQPAVREQLREVIAKLTEGCLTPAEEAGNEEVAAQARKLQQKMTNPGRE